LLQQLSQYSNTHDPPSTFLRSDGVPLTLPHTARVTGR
jgi:hypothetical protein